MIIMGVDFGDARTGLAICDKGEMLASPVCVVSEKDFTQCQEKVAALAKEHRAELLVVQSANVQNCARNSETV